MEFKDKIKYAEARGRLLAAAEFESRHNYRAKLERRGMNEYQEFTNNIRSYLDKRELYFDHLQDHYYIRNVDPGQKTSVDHIPFDSIQEMIAFLYGAERGKY